MSPDSNQILIGLVVLYFPINISTLDESSVALGEGKQNGDPLMTLKWLGDIFNRLSSTVAWDSLVYMFLMSTSYIVDECADFAISL